MKNNDNVTRREFLSRTALTAAGTVIAGAPVTRNVLVPTTASTSPSSASAARFGTHRRLLETAECPRHHALRHRRKTFSTCAQMLSRRARQSGEEGVGHAEGVRQTKTSTQSPLPSRTTGTPWVRSGLPGRQARVRRKPACWACGKAGR